MSSKELSVLQELSTAKVKPPKDVISKLGVANSANYAVNGYTSPPPLVQKFSNVAEESTEPNAAMVQPEPTQETTVVPAAPQPKTTEKFGYNLVGAIPSGYGPANACGNCVHDDYGSCKLHAFPNHYHYTCGDFEIKPVKNNYELFEKPKEAKPLEGDTLSKAAEDYEPILEKFSDGDLASEVLDVVVQRFSARSAYADEFLKLRYRRAYQSKHGNLDNAFLE
jgi:hypothetical protein